MHERIEAELALVRQRFPEVEHMEEGCWFRVPSYPLTESWNRSETDVAFQIAPGYPRATSLRILRPSGILFQGDAPKSYTEPASAQPPFGGVWVSFPGHLSKANGSRRWTSVRDPISSTG